MNQNKFLSHAVRDIHMMHFKQMNCIVKGSVGYLARLSRQVKRGVRMSHSRKGNELSISNIYEP